MSDILAVSDPRGNGRPVPMDGAPDPVSLADLRDALAHRRIRAHYQPIVGVRDKVPMAVEVLARLAHPARGTVLPDLFVPQLEEAGLARPLTEAVSRAAFAEWGTGLTADLGVALSLNFPLDVLLQPAALAWLDRAREAAGIPAADMIIELTESRPVSQIAKIGAAVTHLRKRGYRLAIDDVGPDLRDHRALLALDFSLLKLDKALLPAAMHCPRAAAFLDDTLLDAQIAGMEVVAEGVADDALWAYAAERGIAYAQGYFVARPMIAASVPVWRHGWTSQPEIAPGA